MSTHPAYRVNTELSDSARRLFDLPLDAVLATVGADGSPHTVPVGFWFDGERFIVPTGATTRKVRNVRANPRARVLVIRPAQATGIDDGWVAADGSADVVGGEEAQRLNEQALARYLTEEGRRGYAEVFVPIMDVAIVVTPERWQTWDETAMLDTMTAHGYTAEDAARWYVQR